MFHRYIKLTIDPGTAQGWSLNDAGQYLYYKDGKALTGTASYGPVTIVPLYHPAAALHNPRLRETLLALSTGVGRRLRRASPAWQPPAPPRRTGWR